MTNTNPIDQISIIGNDLYTFDIAQLVQDWLDGTYDNYGIVFYGTCGPGSYQCFYSRNYPISTGRSYLEVDYTIAEALENTTSFSVPGTSLDPGPRGRALTGSIFHRK